MAPHSLGGFSDGELQPGFSARQGTKSKRAKIAKRLNIKGVNLVLIKRGGYFRKLKRDIPGKGGN